MDLTAHAGLTLIAETLLALGVEGLVRDGLRVRARQRGDTEFDKLQAVLRAANAWSAGDSVGIHGGPGLPADRRGAHHGPREAAGSATNALCCGGSPEPLARFYR